MKSFLAPSILAFTALAQAQYAIDPNTVANATRQQWCLDQSTQCPLICLDQGAASGSTESNTCDSTTLTYSCVCDNGLSPNISEYSQTIPYYICTEWGTQCVSNCGTDNTCASACREDHPCGALNPKRQNTSTLTSTRTTSATGAGVLTTTGSDGQVATVYTGFGGQATSTGGSHGGSESSGVRVWALSAGQTFGSVALVGAATLGFAVLL
ncbi:hypothetical protein AC578_6238 [Pseudocercospora eumusae]|uniref:DUF7707 domain-containing protein n=1 Tax=Pseudocercospora eumusae TaxID=321146 RepID=A0A139H334_9PEZI|nr:hypothetical protein AC578_6238 [Pseudocercospora eumusae]